MSLFQTLGHFVCVGKHTSTIRAVFQCVLVSMTHTHSCSTITLSTSRTFSSSHPAAPCPVHSNSPFLLPHCDFCLSGTPGASWEGNHAGFVLLGLACLPWHVSSGSSMLSAHGMDMPQFVYLSLHQGSFGLFLPLGDYKWCCLWTLVCKYLVQTLSVLVGHGRKGSCWIM